MLILVKMNGLRTYEFIGARLGPTKNAMMQQCGMAVMVDGNGLDVRHVNKQTAC